MIKESKHTTTVITSQKTTSRGKKEHKIYKTVKKQQNGNSKSLSVISLNVYGLNSPFKPHSCQVDETQIQTIMPPTRDCSCEDRHHRLNEGI